jgi:hypothetical protein
VGVEGWQEVGGEISAGGTGALWWVRSQTVQVPVQCTEGRDEGGRSCCYSGAECRLSVGVGKAGQV